MQFFYQADDSSRFNATKSIIVVDGLKISCTTPDRESTRT